MFSLFLKSCYGTENMTIAGSQIDFSGENEERIEFEDSKLKTVKISNAVGKEDFETLKNLVNRAVKDIKEVRSDAAYKMEFNEGKMTKDISVDGNVLICNKDFYMNIAVGDRPLEKDVRSSFKFKLLSSTQRYLAFGFCTKDFDNKVSEVD